MSRISHDQVARIAGLARLRLSVEETAQMASDLDQILGYVAALDELDTADIDVTAHAVPVETPLRPDEPVEGLDPALALATAPQSEGSAFVVPKVIDGGEG